MNYRISSIKRPGRLIELSGLTPGRLLEHGRLLQHGRLIELPENL